MDWTIPENDNERLENLWWAMHHSDDPVRQAFPVVCYLDESGTDQKNPKAVMAGFLLNKPEFFSFHAGWLKLLERFKIEPPLHMNEFGQHGRFGRFSFSERAALLTEAANLINSHKFVSIAATVDRMQYETSVPVKLRKHLSMYGICFVMCVWGNYEIAKQMEYRGRIALLLDDITEHKKEIFAARDWIRTIQSAFTMHIGSITFDDDKYVSPLQAADLIAWGVRRRISGVPLDNGFEPISNIFGSSHIEHPLNDEFFGELGSRLQDYSYE